MKKIPQNQLAGGQLVLGDFFLVSVIPLRMIFASSGTKFVFVRVTNLKVVRVTNLKVVRVTNHASQTALNLWPEQAIKCHLIFMR